MVDTQFCWPYVANVVDSPPGKIGLCSRQANKGSCLICLQICCALFLWVFEQLKVSKRGAHTNAATHKRIYVTAAPTTAHATNRDSNNNGASNFTLYTHALARIHLQQPVRYACLHEAYSTCIATVLVRLAQPKKYCKYICALSNHLFACRNCLCVCCDSLSIAA